MAFDRLVIRPIVFLLPLALTPGPSWAEEAIPGSPSAAPSGSAQATPQDSPSSPTRTSAASNPALAELREAVRLRPKDAAVHYDLAVGLLAAHMVPRAAFPSPANPLSPVLESIQALRTAARLAPDWRDPRLLLGDTLYRAGDLNGSLNEFRRLAQEGRPDPRAPLGLAKVLIAKQDWPAAQAALKEAIRLEPTLVEAHYLLGGVLYSQGRVRPAIDAYRKTLWLKPDFADAHHQLGLLLKLGNQQKEAVEAFRRAAEGGLPDAQFLVAQAYKTGNGISAELSHAIGWWIRASEQGHAQAWMALKQLRRLARAGDLQPATKGAAEASKAFADYRASLWQEVPDLPRTDDQDSVGLSLLSRARAAEAVPMLVREALALSESAQAKLEELYEQGGPEGVPPFDPRILAYLEKVATEDILAGKFTLARIYFRGLGVAKDLKRVKVLLKEFPKAERVRIWEQFEAEPPVP